MDNNKNIYKNKFKDYSVCLSAIILITVIFGIYFYNVFVKFQINYMQQYNKNIISKAYDFQNDLIVVSNSLFNNKTVNLYLNGNGEISSSDASKTIKELLNSSTISSMVKNIAVKNQSDGIIYSTLTEKKESLREFCEKYPEYSGILKSNAPGFNTYVNKTKSENTLVYAYNDYKGHIIYAFINEYNLQAHFFSNVSPVDCDIVLLRNSNIVTSNVSKGNTAIFKDAHDNNGDDVKLSGAYITVKTSSKNYSGISAVKISTLFRNAISTGSFLILFAILIFMLACLMTYYFYFKQKKFISEHLKLANKHLDSNAENIVNRLFNYDVLTPADEIALNEYFQINNGSYFLPIVIKITNYSKLAKSVGNDDINVYKYGFVNIITEVCESISSVKIGNMGREYIGVLLYGEESFDIKTVKTKTEYFENVIQKHFNADLFSVIGKEAEDIVSVYEQIPTLINAQNYKFINTENKLVISELAAQANRAEYPLHIQAVIITAVNSKNTEAFNDGIKKFADYIIKSNSLNGKEWFLKLFFALSDNCRQNPNISVSHNTLEAMLNCDKIGEIVDLLSNSVKYLNSSSSETNTEITENFDKIVKKAIEEEFSSPDFCIQSITERFGFTASYFGKKFKHNFDISFNKYLLNYRLNYAVKLLSETDYTNAKIAQLCGFNSETYFTSIFKKNFGVSPKTYKNTYFEK